MLLEQTKCSNVLTQNYLATKTFGFQLWCCWMHILIIRVAQKSRVQKHQSHKTNTAAWLVNYFSLWLVIFTETLWYDIDFSNVHSLTFEAPYLFFSLTDPSSCCYWHKLKWCHIFNLLDVIIEIAHNSLKSLSSCTGVPWLQKLRSPLNTTQT